LWVLGTFNESLVDDTGSATLGWGGVVEGIVAPLGGRLKRFEAMILMTSSHIEIFSWRIMETGDGIYSSQRVQWLDPVTARGFTV
jgi:hypothetical protein